MNPWQHLIDKHQAALRSADGIFTWTTQDELAWLAEEASKRLSILEIGTYAGHSARVLARSTKGTVTCFDMCPDPGVEEAARRNLKGEHGLTLIHGHAGVSAVRYFLKHLQSGGFTFDMIWIDDGHTYADVVRDCLIALLLKQDEMVFICGHDYEKDASGQCNEVAKAVNDCFGEKNIKRGPGSIWHL